MTISAGSLLKSRANDVHPSQITTDWRVELEALKDVPTKIYLATLDLLKKLEAAGLDRDEVDRVVVPASSDGAIFGSFLAHHISFRNAKLREEKGREVYCHSSALHHSHDFRAYVREGEKVLIAMKDWEPRGPAFRLAARIHEEAKALSLPFIGVLTNNSGENTYIGKQVIALIE